MKYSLIFSRLACLAAVLLLLGGCTASRTIILSGKVTPQGEFKGGFNASGNISTQTAVSLAGISKAAVDAALNRDSVFYDEQVNQFAKGVVAYSLDPISPNFDVYVRYGLLDRVDVGYKFAFGAHVLDAMYQFLGSTGTPDNPGQPGLYGSIGLQYSGQKSNLPGRLFLNRLESLFNYNATRRDLMVPLIFSQSFGVEESMGHIAFGIAYNHTFIRYAFEPTNLFEREVGSRVNRRVEGVSARKSFGSYGAFINGKLGYRFVYLLPALSIFYQKYGTFELLGNQTATLKGFTFLPSLGLQATIAPRKQR